MFTSTQTARQLSRSEILQELNQACEELELSSKTVIFKIQPLSEEPAVYLCRLKVNLKKGSDVANRLHATCQALEKQSRDELAIIIDYQDFSEKIDDYLQRVREGLSPNPDFAEPAPTVRKKSIHPENYRDLRNIPFFTIDPDGTEDIDDALAVVGKDLYVAFADVTPIISSWSDPLLHYAGRFGVSLYYGKENSVRMLGDAGNEASLFQDEERFAWVVKIRINGEQGHSEDGANFEIFRALIKNRAKFNYEIAVDEISDPEVRESFIATQRAVAELEAQRLQSNLAMLEKSEFANEKLISTAMITAKNYIAKFLAANTPAAFYRVHEPDLKETDLGNWVRSLSLLAPDEKFNTADFKDRERLLRLIRRCMHHSDLNVRAIGQEIFNHFIGVATFSLTPDIHSGLKLKPYADIKALRKCDGAYNQLILAAAIYNEGKIPELATLRTFLNLLKSTKRDYFSNFALLQAHVRFKREQQRVLV